MRSDICVAVASHRPYRMPGDDGYLPLHVGAALHPDACPGMQPDDDGDNISTLNPRYCELTGLYWMWRNCCSARKGLVHYRRLLGSLAPDRRKSKDPYGRIATASELKSLVDGHGVVVAKRRVYGIETVYGHYAHTFEASQFDACREVLSSRCPEYVPAWDRLMRSRGAHLFNMFVMRSDLFDSYCAWLFPVLADLDTTVDSSRYDPFAGRWIGRVSERLLDPWLETNRHGYAELPVVSPEPVDWVKKGSSFLAAKFLGKKYGRSF